MSELGFRVIGEPAPQGSAKAFVVKAPFGPRAVVVHDNPRVRPWRALVADAALQAGAAKVVGVPMSVALTFYLARPQSLPKRVVYPYRRPDLDKLIRSALDALTGVVWGDDAQVQEVHASKVFAAHQPPGLEVMVRWNDPEPPRWNPRPTTRPRFEQESFA